MKKSCLLLECFGLPGAGKSTVVNEVLSELKNNGHNVYTIDDFNEWCLKLNKLRKALLFLRNPFRIIRFTFSIYRYAGSISELPHDRVARLRSSPFRLVYLEYFASNHVDSILILDQFEIQKIWSLAAFNDEYSKRHLKASVISLLKVNPVQTIYFKCDSTTAASRLSQRETMRSRFDFMTYDEALTALNQAQQVMEEIYNTIKRHCHDPIILDASADIDANKKLLISHIHSLC